MNSPKTIPDTIGAAESVVSGSARRVSRSSTTRIDAGDRNTARGAPEDSLLGVLRYWRNLGLDARDLAQIIERSLHFRIFRLSGEIDEAFLAQPFNLDLAPDDPANQRRFSAYTSYISRVIRLMKEAAEASQIVNKMPAHSATETATHHDRSR